MSRSRWLAIAICATVVVSVTIEIIVNLITKKFTVVLGVTLVVLVVVSALLALLVTGAARSSSVVGFGGRSKEPSRSQRDITLARSLKQVEEMLNDSLRQFMPMRLALDNRPDLAGPSRHPGTVDATPRSRLLRRPICEEFEHRTGRLILLGAAGSGKTTLLFELARDLIVAAQRGNSDRIPIALNLSSWSDDDASFVDWLLREACRDNNIGVNEEVFEYWLGRDEFALLLDGIDEIEGEAQRVRCCEEVAKFREARRLTYIALCCRTENFSGLGEVLGIRDIVELQPPTREEVGNFLSELERRGTGLTAVRAALETDNDFMTFLCSPLVLQLVAVAYTGEPEDSTASLLDSGTSAQRLARLWDRYIPKMFEQRPLHRGGYSMEQAIAWLDWLAGAMVRRKTDAFQLDRLGDEVGKPVRLGKDVGPHNDLRDRFYRPPHWYPLLVLFEALTIQPLLASGLLSIPLGGPFNIGILLGIAYLIVAWHGGVWSAALAGLLSATAFSALISRTRTDSGFSQGWPVVERVYWSRSRFVGRLWWSVFQGLGNGLAGGLVAGIRIGILNGLWHGIVFGVAASFGISVINGLAVGADSTLVGQGPDAGIRRSLSYSLQFAMAGGLMGFLVGWLIGLAAAGRDGGIVLGLGSALGMALFAGRAFGGGACLAYCSRLLWLAEAHVAPWEYGPFLEGMAERTILRRGGRAYFFVHRLLRDHLAEKASVLYADILAEYAEDVASHMFMKLRPGMRTGVFGRFRNDARQLIDRAQEEARRWHHGNVTPTHILLALAGEPDGSVVKTVLTPSQVSHIHSYLNESMSQGSENAWGDIPFAFEAQNVFRLSQLEASRMNSSEIGCEHVLLGLVRARDKTVSDILVDIEAELDSMRRKVAASSKDRAI